MASTSVPAPGPLAPLPMGTDVEVFFDGDCPLCRREIGMLQRLDKRRRIRFTDIAAPGFDAAALGVTQSDLMAEIHGRRANGELMTGVEVFRQLYTAVGWGWAMGLTRLPGIRSLLDLAYRAFARNRLRLTGRCDQGKCVIQHSASAESVQTEHLD